MTKRRANDPAVVAVLILAAAVGGPVSLDGCEEPRHRVPIAFMHAVGYTWVSTRQG
jgi:hypothetical protein